MYDEYLVWHKNYRKAVSTKVLKCLNQCFAWLRSWKSVSSKTAIDQSSRFCEFETLFQHRSRAKHWFKNLKILTRVLFRSTTKLALPVSNWLSLLVTHVSTLYYNYLYDYWITPIAQKMQNLFDLFTQKQIYLNEWL